MVHEKKIVVLDFLIIKNFCSTKDIVKRMKNKPQTGRKYLQNIYISDKGLVSKIYKRTLKLNNEEKKKHLQYGQKIWADTPPKKIYRCQISILKDTQYHMSLGSCKLKSDTTTHLIE